MSNAVVKLLYPSCVLLNCDLKTSDEVIQAIGNQLFEAGFVKDSFIQAAIERESSMPTGLPLSGGINAAIPHTEIDHVLKPCIGMATLKNEVEFQNMISPQEKVPVRLVFLLALEQPKAQIEMLQEVANILQNPTLVKKLIEQKTFKEIIKTLEEA